MANPSDFPTSLTAFNETGTVPTETPGSHTAAHLHERAAINKLEQALGKDANKLIRYIDAADGSDSNNGQKASKAQKTFEAARADLQAYAVSHFNVPSGTTGIGKIVCLPGADFDLAGNSGIAYNYPVEVVGQVGGGDYVPNAGAAIRFFNSDPAALQVLKVGDLPTGNNTGYGFSISGVAFIWNPNNTSMTALLRIMKTTRPRVFDVHGLTSDASNKDVPLIEHDGGYSGNTDGASFDFRRCVTRGVPLLHALGGNLNRGFMGYCECQFGSGATYPMVWIQGAWWSSTLAFTALEGGASGPHVRLDADPRGSVGAPQYNTFIVNGGEASTITYPFYDVIQGGLNRFVGGMCTGVAGVGVWAQFASAAYPNRVENQRVSYQGVSGLKAQIINNAQFPAANTIEGKNGPILWQKTGAAPTFSSSDFPSAPLDGSVLGVTANTSTGEKRVWYIINGSYVSVVVA